MVKKSLMVLLVCLFASFASATIVADSQADFIATGGAQNTLGWSYGLYYPAGGWFGDPLIWLSGENAWAGSNGRVGADYMHPHSTDWQIYRNWTSDVTGVVDISGTAITNPDSTDGVKLVIKFNGAEIWSRSLLGSEGQITYNIPGLSINAGDNLMFALEANNSIQFDGSSWIATVNQIPEPATMSLLGLGLLGLVRRGRK